MDFFQDESVISGKVALVGPPNVGKSTLLNTLLKQKISIVTPKPQTTRNRIAGVLNEADYQIVFLDTPGLHRSGSLLNRELGRIAMASFRDVDAVVFMLDVSSALPGPKQREKREEYLEYFKEISCPALLLLNKIDLVDRTMVLSLIATYSELYPFKAIIPISAKKGDGTDRLVQELLAFLPKGYRYFSEDVPTDASQRFLAAEIIREKVFLLTGQEIPYSSAVMIDSFKEESHRVTIHATIYLERPSQKGIVIGKGGSKLKAIGTAARHDIEQMVNNKVVLKLWVKIRKNWSSDASFLKELGF